MRDWNRKGAHVGDGEQREMGVFENQLIAMLTQLYTFTKTHRTTLKWVEFVVYKLYLTKSVLKIYTHSLRFLLSKSFTVGRNNFKIQVL